MALRDIKVDEDDFGLLSYDPAFMNTASCRSAITFIDGEQGILRYRGYPIQELAERVSFLEVAWLLVEGDFPTRSAAGRLDRPDQPPHLRQGEHQEVHRRLPPRRPPHGHPGRHGGALSTFYPDAKKIDDPAVRRRQIVRLIAKIPTLAAYAYRHSQGHPYPYPDNELSYAGNFLNLMWKMGSPSTTPTRSSSTPWTCCSPCMPTTSRTARPTPCGPSAAPGRPFSAAAAAVAALYGPLHGGANELVLRMLNEIGSVDQVPAYVERVKQGEMKLMGFGHRVYKNYDPRARIIKQVADDVFKVTGLNPLLEIAVELERIALEDDYFVSKKLYPNVDFYSGIIYEAMGFPTEMFPVLFAIGRMPGWLAQWEENLSDPEQRIARPRRSTSAPASATSRATERLPGTGRPGGSQGEGTRTLTRRLAADVADLGAP